MGGKPRNDKAQAKAEIAKVEAYLRDGCPPRGMNGGGSRQPSALVLAARDLGLPISTLDSRLGSPSKQGIYQRKFGLSPKWALFKGISDKYLVPSKQAAAQPLGGGVGDRELISLRDEVKRLKSALTEAHRQALDDEAIVEILGGLRDAEVAPPNWISSFSTPKKGNSLPEVPMTIWSDWHCGETVEPTEINNINAYSIAISEARVERLVEGTVNLAFNHHSGNYPGIVVNLLGDFISGGLHPELAKTDEEEVIPAALKARDLLVAALTRIADKFGQVYCPCVSGNHGRATHKPEFKRYAYQNFDWLIYQLLLRHFADDTRIRFTINPSNDVYYKVYNLRFLSTHGDMLGVKGGDGIIGLLGPVARGEIKTSRQSAAMAMDYDYLLMGHWHQQLWLPRAIVANTLKGFDEYAHKKLRAVPTRPTQPLWFVHPQHGITAMWNVFVGEEDKQADAAWVSWPK